MKKVLMLILLLIPLAANFSYGQKKVKIGNETLVVPKKVECSFEDMFDGRMVSYQRSLEIKSDTLYLYSLMYDGTKSKVVRRVTITIIPINLIDFESSAISQNNADEKICGYTATFSTVNSSTYFKAITYTKESKSAPINVYEGATYTNNMNLLTEVKNKKLSGSK